MLHLGLAAIAVWQFTVHYRDLFPGDPAQRWALHQCFVANHHFDPLNRGERQACFREELPQPRLAASARQHSMPPRPNFVDLRREAGSPMAGPHDIRARQARLSVERPAAYRLTKTVPSATRTW